MLSCNILLLTTFFFTHCKVKNDVTHWNEILFPPVARIRDRQKIGWILIVVERLFIVCVDVAPFKRITHLKKEKKIFLLPGIYTQAFQIPITQIQLIHGYFHPHRSSNNPQMEWSTLHLWRKKWLCGPETFFEGWELKRTIPPQIVQNRSHSFQMSGSH